MNDYRAIPAVNKLLEIDSFAGLVDSFGHTQVVNAIRETLDEIRNDTVYKEFSYPETAAKVESKLHEWFMPTQLAVINATGVVIHTNLGRAPLPKTSLQAIQQAGMEYSTLEFDISTGKRGSRSVHAEIQLKKLLGVEAALVVNNNAGAVMLCLAALANRRKVVISRTQLVEIGGGFRIPDVMRQSGAKLVEIGTTNRVHLADYKEALTDNPALVLHAHHSNYRIIGFSSEPALSDVVEAAHAKNILVMDDLGSGALLDTAHYGLMHEPTVQESLAADVDVVCFSGDKLLGGPQAGIIVGRNHLIDKIKKHPLARVVRADKLCLAALSATLIHYLRGDVEQSIPVWQMLAKLPEDLKNTALHWQQILGTGEVIEGKSAVGGGSLPEETQPTWLFVLSVKNPDRFLAKLRAYSTPIIARIEGDKVFFDPRTVFPEQEDEFLRGIRSTLQSKITQKESK